MEAGQTPKGLRIVASLTMLRDAVAAGSPVEDHVLAREEQAPFLMGLRRALEADGLAVVTTGDDANLIADQAHEAAPGLRVLSRASVLVRRPSDWLAIVPGPGMTCVEVPGTLEDLLRRIRRAYAGYRAGEGTLRDCFEAAATGEGGTDESTGLR